MIATWCTIPSLLSVEAILFGTNGMAISNINNNPSIDTIILDNEHSNFSYDMVKAIAHLVWHHERNIMVRIPRFDEVQLLKYYEMRVPVLVSHVENRGAADSIYRSINYPPIGWRGFSPYTSCQNLMMIHKDTTAYSMKRNNEGYGKVNIMLEGDGIAASDEFEHILNCNIRFGLIYIGIYDLANYLGYNGNVNHPQVLGLLKERVRSIRAKKIMAGTHATTQADITMFRKMGFDFIAHENDAHMLADAYRQRLSKFQPPLGDLIGGC